MIQAVRAQAPRALVATLFAGMLVACTAGPVREVSEVPQSSTIPPGVAEAPQRLAQPTNVRPRIGEVGSRKITPPMIDELYLGGGRPVNAKAPQPARGPRATGDITLDFRDADIQEVARVILGDLLRANYVIDPDVSGGITLQTGRPVNKSALLPALEAALEGRGARVVMYGNIYRVTKNPGVAGVAAGGLRVGTEAGGEGAGLRIFPLEFIAAEEMAKILQPMLPENSIPLIDPDRNMIMVAGTGPQLALASGTVNVFDVDQMSGQSVLLTSLENVDANTMVAELEGIFAASGKGGPRGPVRFIPVDRLNAVMTISRQVRYLEEARHWIYRLDRTRSANETRLFVYYVQNGRAADLAKTLRAVFADGAAVEPPDSTQPRGARRPDVVRTELDYPRTAGTARGNTTSSPNTFNVQQPLDRPGRVGEPPPAPGPAGAAAADSPSSLLTRNQQANAAQGPAGGAPGRLGAGVRITADEKNNALLIAATPKDFELIQDVLEKVDLVPLQVLVEATIFEVSLQDQLRYGVQYLISNGGLGIGNDGTAILTKGTDITDLAAAAAGSLPGFAFTINGTDRVRFVIDALSSLTEVNVISSPHVLVLDNQPARLQVGDEVPIITQQATSTVTSNPLVVNTVQYRQTGVTLEVTPRVNSGGLVTLDVAQEVSDVTTTTTSTINSPTIQQRTISSTIAIQDNETVMLGGLIREDARETQAGIPVLHRIPVLGALFGATNAQARRTELIVLITPRVITSAQDARDMTQDMRRKFLNLLRLQQDGVRQPRRVIKDHGL
ncbi:MAG: type II secretion system secretin GspD [Alphaproteobacteria bacterium]|nr:type II secretion system secretin GspD [Alphaproteobacteria bacterium]